MSKVCIFVLFFTSVANLALASGPVLSQSFTISLGPGSNQIAPAVTYNSTDEQYLVVWQDDRNVDAGGYDLFGQLLASDGGPIGEEFIVSDAPGHQRAPALAYNSTDNQYLIVWTDGREEVTRGGDIFAQRVDGDGTPVGSNFPITTVPGDQTSPTITYNSEDNQYLVVWLGTQIVGQRVSSSGDLLGASFTISTGMAAKPALAYNEIDNQYLIVWSDGARIMGQRIHANGSRIGDNFPLSVPPPIKPPFHPRWRFSAFAPAISYNGRSNEYLVFWSEGFWVTAERTRDFDAYGQRVNSDGTLLGSKFRVSNASGIQSYLSLTYNSSEEQYMAVWTFDPAGVPARPLHLFGQRINHTGSLIGSNFAIANAPRNQSWPAVAYDGAYDLYLVVWSDDREVDTRRWDLFGQLVVPNGSPKGMDFLISPDPDPDPTPAAGNEFSAAITYNSMDNQYMVVWTTDTRAGVRATVFGQRIASNGEAIGPSFTISSPAMAHHTPTVVYNSTDNQYMVVWAQQPDPSSTGILAQRVSADGKLLGANFRLSDSTSTQRLPAVAYNSNDDQYLVAWEDRLTSGPSAPRILGQLLDADGRRLGGHIAISIGGSGTAPTVAYNSTGNQYLVAWEDTRNGIFNNAIYGQRLETDGTPIGANFPISTAANRRTAPSAAYNSRDNEYMIAWSDARITPAESDIFGQRVAATGNLIGANFPVSTAPGLQEQPRIAYNSVQDEYLITWFDVRNFPASERAVYAQLMDAAGRAMGSELLIARTNRSLGQLILPSTEYNSVENQYLVIWDDDRELGTLRDVIGRFVSPDE